MNFLNRDWFNDKIIRNHLIKVIPYLKGRLLDIGCGNKPYRDMLVCSDYVGIDFDIRNLKYDNKDFDSILCTQVLEHIDDIDKAFKELYRVLRFDGYLCITVPLIVRLHGDDYWRFTEMGIEYLFKKYNFKKVFIKPMGGFLTTQCFLWNYFVCEKLIKIRLIRILFSLIMNPIFLLIHKIDRDTTTPFNYIALAKKK